MKDEKHYEIIECKACKQTFKARKCNKRSYCSIECSNGSLHDSNENNLKPKKSSKVFHLSYMKIEKDINGWVKEETAKPEEYDLVSLHLETDRKIMGWWTGHGWAGLRLGDKDKVKFWHKRLTREEGLK